MGRCQLISWLRHCGGVTLRAVNVKDGSDSQLASRLAGQATSGQNGYLLILDTRKEPGGPPVQPPAFFRRKRRTDPPGPMIVPDREGEPLYVIVVVIKDEEEQLEKDTFGLRAATDSGQLPIEAGPSSPPIVTDIKKELPDDDEVGPTQIKIEFEPMEDEEPSSPSPPIVPLAKRRKTS